MLLMIWPILVVRLGTGFPARHKNVGHKVSFPSGVNVFLKFSELQLQVSKTLRSFKISPDVDKTYFLSNN